MVSRNALLDMIYRGIGKFPILRNQRTTQYEKKESTLRVLIIVPRTFWFFLQWQSEAKAALATYGRRLLH